MKDAPDVIRLPVVAGPEVLIYDHEDMPDSLVASEVVQFVAWSEGEGQQLASPSCIAVSGEMWQRVEQQLETIVSDGRPALAAR